MTCDASHSWPPHRARCSWPACATAASAAPVWNLDIHHNQTNFAPGGTGQLWFDVNNVGTTASSGPSRLTVNLPKGLTRKTVTENEIRQCGTRLELPGVGGR